MKSFIKFAICLTSGEYHLKIQNSWYQEWGTLEGEQDISIQCPVTRQGCEGEGSVIGYNGTRE